MFYRVAFNRKFRQLAHIKRGHQGFNQSQILSGTNQVWTPAAKIQGFNFETRIIVFPKINFSDKRFEPFIQFH